MPDQKKDSKGKEDTAATAAAAAAAKKKEEEEKPKPLTLVQELKANLDLLVKATENRTHGPILRVLRRTNHVRRHLPNADLQRFVERYVSSDMPAKTTLLAAISQLEATAKDEKAGEPEELVPLVTSASTDASAVHYEVEIYLSNIVVNGMLRSGKYDSAATLALMVYSHFSTFNKRNLDVFTSQTISFLSLAHQSVGTLSSIRHFLLKAHRSACLQHNEFGQATIINLLLRNYLNDNLVEQAAKLVAKVNFPENVSANQYVRHLYYLGRIQCVQLQYTESYSNLNQAFRKAPQNTAVGFRTAVTKLSIIVQLLMGDIPERSLFSESSTAEAVAPYLELTQAVRFGRLDVFNEVIAKFEDIFRRDTNFNLIQRLRQTVMKIGESNNCSMQGLRSVCDCCFHRAMRFGNKGDVFTLPSLLPRRLAPNQHFLFTNFFFGHCGKAQAWVCGGCRVCLCKEHSRWRDQSAA